MPRFTPPTARRVRAQWPGYYRGHRREGETFDFVPAQASAPLPKWLAPVDEPLPAGPVDGGTAKGAGEPDALAAAIAALDPADDAHWTKAGIRGDGGKPSLLVLTDATGHRVTRSMAEAAAPGFDRDAARKATRDRAGEAFRPAAKDAAGSGGGTG